MILINKDSKIKFKEVKWPDILGTSYGRLKFKKCRNHKYLTSFAKSAYI